MEGSKRSVYEDGEFYPIFRRTSSNVESSTNSISLQRMFYYV